MSSQPRGTGARVDLATVPRSVWISAGAALVLLISVFLRWYSVEVKGLGGFSIGASASGWDATDLSKLIALLALVALGAWAVEVFWPATRLPYPAWMIAGASGALAALLVLFRIIDKPGPGIPEGSGISISTSYGIWVALLAALAVVAGAYLRMKETSANRV